MGRSADFLPRLVRNVQLQVTQTRRICPKQLLDAALVAPPISCAPKAFNVKSEETAGAAFGHGSSDFIQRASASHGQSAPGNSETSGRGAGVSPLHDCLNLQQQTWATLETQALLALPTLSPAGILQFLFLTLRGNFRPAEFLEELHRFLLYDEPAAPPVAIFWRLWTANDLALLYKGLVKHGVSSSPLFAQILGRLAVNLAHVDACDAALVLTTAAESPDFGLTLALLRPLDAEDFQTQTAKNGAPYASVEALCGGLGDDRLAVQKDRKYPNCSNGEASPLFVALLDVFCQQLPRATLNDCVRVFHAAGRTFSSLVSCGAQAVCLFRILEDKAGLPQQVDRLHRNVSAQSFCRFVQSKLAQPGEKMPGDLQSSDADLITLQAAAWQASLRSFTGLARHLKCLVSAASPRAKLRMVAGAVQMWRLLKHPNHPARLSLHAAVAEALHAAASAETMAERAATDVCNGISDNKEKKDHNLAPSAGLLAVLQSSLFGIAEERIGGADGEARALASNAEVLGLCAERARCKAAVCDLLSSVLPAVCGSPDLSLNECLFLLDSFWQLHVSLDFAVPFSWVEGLFFRLASNIHELASPQLLAFTTCVGFYLPMGSLFESRSSGGVEIRHSPQVTDVHPQQSELVALLRQRIYENVKERMESMTPKERLVFMCLDKASNNKSLL